MGSLLGIAGRSLVVSGAGLLNPAVAAGVPGCVPV